MTFERVRRRLLVVLTIAQVVLVMGGCTMDPARLALPGAVVSGPTYPVHIQFANALNLPARAKVVANGARVGQLNKVTIVSPGAGPGYAVANVDIQQSVRLPASTKAQLRQDTVLGDVYISLATTPTAGDGTTITPGGTIPLRQTEPALQIEDVIAGMANFISGGAVRSAQDIIHQVNAALPPDPAETARIFGTVKEDIIDLGANLDSIDTFLDGVQAGATAIQDNKAAVDVLLTRGGGATVTAIAQSLIHTVGIVGALGGLADALTWLAPAAHELDATAKAFIPLLLAKDRALNLRAPSNLNSLRMLVREKVLDYFRHGSRTHFNVTGIEVEDAAGQTTVPSDEQVDQILATLRMIGFAR